MKNNSANNNKKLIEIIIPAKYVVSPAMIDGLEHMGSLTKLDFKWVPTNFIAPLTRLFEMASRRTVFGGRDRCLPDLVEPVFTTCPNMRQWVSDTDIKHTVASFSYLAEICQKENFTAEESKVVLSALIVHDCAYPKTEDFKAFTNSNVRLLHMQEGEKEFINFASKINEEFPDFYSEETIQTIRSVVRQHDNPNVIQNGSVLQFDYMLTAPKLIWAHREADRLWMLDHAGFALDLLRRLLEPNPWHNPQLYFNGVVLSHIKEADCYYDNQECRLYQNNRTFYRTNAGFQIFQRLIKACMKNYDLKLSLNEIAYCSNRNQ
jgi:hypothetical protein